ncbi:MAG: hypothetical protein ABI376_04510 [Caulobacteraceae bacterium]
MKHAGPAALDRLEPLLGRIRALGVLQEKTRGCFYLKSKAFLHFHEDSAGLFADVREENGAFQRFKVDDPGSQTDLLRRLPTTGAGRSGAKTPGSPRSRG